MSDPMDFPPPPPRPQGARSSSSGCLKWGLLGCGGALCLFVLFAFGIGWYASRHGKELLAGADQNMRDGIAQARRSDENGCVDAARKRMEKGSAFSAGLDGAMYLGACLKSSQPAAGFCDGVPRPDDIARSSAWLQQRCADKALSPSGNIRCQALNQTVQRYCTVEGRPKESPEVALARLDSVAAALKRGFPKR